MESAEIARRFLALLRGARAHRRALGQPRSPTTRRCCSSIAGHGPFKPYFLGQQTPPCKRAADVQKCVRTLDIDEVGKTTRHGTFFQMLGNFSFGDYFKEGAIPFAWELLTKSRVRRRVRLPRGPALGHRLHDDDEAYAIWRDEVGVPEDRIQRRGLADNYWHMGVPGPGGPCSEIYYDRGPEYGREGGPEVDEDRYLEVWNLVFMQDQLSAVRTKVDFDVVGALPVKNIDTGMGLERMAAHPAGRRQHLRDRHHLQDPRPGGRADRAEVRHATTRTTWRLRVVADHVRSAVMLIDDGVRARQRGPRLRAAPDPAPQHPQPAAAVGAQRGGGGARRGTGFMHELTAAAIERDGRASTPSCAATRRTSTASSTPRRRPSWTRSAPAPRSSTSRSRRPSASGASDAARRAGVPAARHLRLPDRPHPGDGGRAGPARSTRRASAA